VQKYAHEKLPSRSREKNPPWIVSHCIKRTSKVGLQHKMNIYQSFVLRVQKVGLKIRPFCQRAIMLTKSETSKVTGQVEQPVYFLAAVNS
jgi:hypothetical protein